MRNPLFTSKSAVAVCMNPWGRSTSWTFTLVSLNSRTVIVGSTLWFLDLGFYKCCYPSKYVKLITRFLSNVDLGSSDVISSFSYKGIGCPVACPLVFISGIHIFWGYGLILLFNVFEIVWVKLSRIYPTDMLSIVLIMLQSKYAYFLRNLFFYS